MRVLLINIPLSVNAGLMAQYGLEMIEASLMKYGHSVDIVDGQIEDLSVTDISNIIISAQESADIIGLSSLPSAVYTLEDILAETQSHISKSIPIVLGGYITTHYKEELFTIEGGKLLDIIVYGKGEHTMQEIVEAYENKSTFTQIPNISFQDNDSIVTTPRKPVSITDLPWSNRTLSLRLQEKGEDDLSILRIYKSAGCLNFCSFCDIHSYITPDKSSKKSDMRNQFWISRSPEDIVDEMEYLHNRFGTSVFDFIDDEALGARPDDWYTVSDLLVKRGLIGKVEYYLSTKVMRFNAHKDMLRRMAQTGLRGVFLGFESADYRVLRELNKDVTFDGKFFQSGDEYVKALDSCLAIAREENFKLKLGVINLLADSDLDEFKRSIDFIKNKKILYNVEGLVRPVGVFGDTQIRRRYNKKGHLNSQPIERDWQNRARYCYDFVDPDITKLFGLWQQYSTPTHLERLELLRDTYVLREDAPEMFYFRQLRDVELKVVQSILSDIEDGIDGHGHPIIEKGIDATQTIHKNYQRFKHGMA